MYRTDYGEEVLTDNQYIVNISVAVDPKPPEPVEPGSPDVTITDVTNDPPSPDVGDGNAHEGDGNADPGEGNADEDDGGSAEGGIEKMLEEEIDSDDPDTSKLMDPKTGKRISKRLQDKDKGADNGMDDKSKDTGGKSTHKRGRKGTKRRSTNRNSTNRKGTNREGTPSDKPESKDDAEDDEPETKDGDDEEEDPAKKKPKLPTPPMNCVGEHWAVHSNSANLGYSTHTFDDIEGALPTMVLFDNGSVGRRLARTLVKKHLASNIDHIRRNRKNGVAFTQANTRCSLNIRPNTNTQTPKHTHATTPHHADTHTNPYTQPLYVSMATFEECARLNVDATAGVHSLPTLMHMGNRLEVKGDTERELVENTFVWSHVEDNAQRKAHMQRYANLPKNTQNPSINDTRKVLQDMNALVTGSAYGVAFVSKITNYDDPGVALAALVVAMFSSPGGTIWDLTKKPPLKALPMAALVLGRNYVRLEERFYRTMIDTMDDITYLREDCRGLFDGRWHEDTKEYSLLTVNHSFCVCMSLL